MLGMIHRTVLGYGPEQFKKFFRLAEVSKHPNGRIALGFHDKQLQSYRCGNFLDTTAHSLLGAIDVYNLLPKYAIAAGDVSTFQNRLQQLLKAGAQDALPGWSTMLSNRHLIFKHPLLRFGSFEGPVKKGGCALATSGIGDEGMRTCVDGDTYNCVDQWLAFGQGKDET